MDRARGVQGNWSRMEAGRRGCEGWLRACSHLLRVLEITREEHLLRVLETENTHTYCVCVCVCVC